MVADHAALDRDCNPGGIEQETRAASLQKRLLDGPDFQKGRKLRRAAQHPKPGCFLLGQDSPGNVARLPGLEVDTDGCGGKSERSQVAARGDRAEGSGVRKTDHRASRRIIPDLHGGRVVAAPACDQMAQRRAAAKKPAGVLAVPDAQIPKVLRGGRQACEPTGTFERKDPGGGPAVVATLVKALVPRDGYARHPLQTLPAGCQSKAVRIRRLSPSRTARYASSMVSREPSVAVASNVGQ